MAGRIATRGLLYGTLSVKNGNDHHPSFDASRVRHLDQDIARRYANAELVPEWVDTHLRENDCHACHARAVDALDEIFVEIEAGRDKRDLVELYLKLDKRYRHRHLCPIKLDELYFDGDPAAIRHARYCPECAREIAHLKSLESDGKP